MNYSNCLPLIFFVVLLYSTSGLGQERGASANEKVHTQCLSAYSQLPLDFTNGEMIERRGDAVVHLGNDFDLLKQHFLSESKAYEAYDAACFFGWMCNNAQPLSCLKHSTVEFIETVGGVLFTEEKLGQSVPYCSAFRISRRKIATAAHCIRPLMTFRLLAFPHRPIKVALPDELSSGASVLSDYAILNIEDNEIPFHLTQDDFSRATLANQHINIITLSIPAYVIMKLTADDWLAAVRFTRLEASRLWSYNEIRSAPVSENAARECLVHRGMTFSGMSGAPILGIWRPVLGGEKPTIRIIGIHLRNGFPSSDCGDVRDFNVGIRIPDRILQEVPLGAHR